ncbi:hypothetical protein B0H19DRAFT_1066786 [Mycena capillaripes]|nr:hypothetical protein B0H19DRAFT_1066786 [Mycena capillaripes]
MARRKTCAGDDAQYQQASEVELRTSEHFLHGIEMFLERPIGIPILRSTGIETRASREKDIGEEKESKRITRKQKLTAKGMAKKKESQKEHTTAETFIVFVGSSAACCLTKVRDLKAATSDTSKREENDSPAADEREDEPSAPVLSFSLDMIHPRIPDFSDAMSKVHSMREDSRKA